MAKNFEVYIECGNNSAFADPGPELARILRELARRVEVAGPVDDSWSLADVNGNLVGSASLEFEDYES